VLAAIAVGLSVSTMQVDVYERCRKISAERYRRTVFNVQVTAADVRHRSLRWKGWLDGAARCMQAKVTSYVIVAVLFFFF